MTIKDIITNLNEFAANLPSGVENPVDMICVEDVTGLKSLVFPDGHPDSYVEVRFEKERNALVFKANPAGGGSDG